MQNKDWMIKNNIFLILIGAFELVLAHSLFFAEKAPILSLNGAVIFIQAFLFYGLILSSGKKATLVLHFLINFLLVLLLIYHRVYSEPISLGIIHQQYQEGIEYLKRSLSVLWNKNILIIALYFVLSELLIWRFYQSGFSKRRQCLIYMVPLLIFYGKGGFDYNHQKFYRDHFNTAVEIFGYPQGWMYELITNYGEQEQIDNVIKMANEKALPLPQELSHLKKHNHIYLIQMESMHYEAFSKEENGKKVMPFLNAISKNAAVYKLFKRIPNPSANSDFATTHGIYHISDYYYVIYQITMPESLYQKITPWTWKYKQQDYYLDFYHGFAGSFYNRRPFIEAQNFDETYFYEELKGKLPEYEDDWGVADLELSDFIIKNQKKNNSQKSLTLYITVTPHDPFAVGKRYTKIYQNPQNLIEQYFNAYNYMDDVLKNIISQAPQDSLFIIYSDHPVIKELSSETFFMVYSNNQSFPHWGYISFDNALQIIKSILSEQIE